MALLLLSCATLLSGCATASMPAPDPYEIPESLLQSGQPGVVVDPETATQADMAEAWAQTYEAWEYLADNIEQIRVIVAAWKEREK